MGSVSLEPLGIILAVTLNAYIVHEVAPLLFEEVFASLNTIKEEVACARGKMVGVVVPCSVKLQSNMSIYSHRKVIVEYIDRLQNKLVF